jgi:hypothetical protein
LVVVATVVGDRVAGEYVWEGLVAILQAEDCEQFCVDLIEKSNSLEEFAGNTVGDDHVFDNQGFPVFVIFVPGINVGCEKDRLEEDCNIVACDGHLLQFPVVLRYAGPP